MVHTKKDVFLTVNTKLDSATHNFVVFSPKKKGVVAEPNVLMSKTRKCESSFTLLRDGCSIKARPGSIFAVEIAAPNCVSTAANSDPSSRSQLSRSTCAFCSNRPPLKTFYVVPVASPRTLNPPPFNNRTP